MPNDGAWDTKRRQASSGWGFRLRLERETDGDNWEVETLLDTAFGTGRRGLPSYRLRAGVDPVPELALVARDEHAEISGTIRFWPISVGSGEYEALLLGPIAVHPTRQGEGIGAWLIREGLDRACKAGWRFVVLVGDHAYYSRFGFKRCEGVSFPPPTDPARLLWLGIDGSGASLPLGSIGRWCPESFG